MLTGLDRLLAEPSALAGRRYALLAHQAAVTAELVPAHLALALGAAPPSVLFGPEHGYYAVEQDMVASADAEDPVTGCPIRSLYGHEPASLRPSRDAFAGLELLLIDLQDAGSRYYTYAATAVWAAQAALAAGCEVWVLDRPNPLGGARIEGNLRQPGFESFVGAFELPVRHGLTLGELCGWALDRPAELRVWEMEGWSREMTWPETGRPWIAPSPNMPTWDTAVIYPGGCLVEGTLASEGRGTTRPFLLVGAPGLDTGRLADDLHVAALPGVRCVPTYFRPQFQKHAGEVCAGVEIVVTDAGRLPSYRFGVELVAALHAQLPAGSVWRREAYEFVTDRPAIDLLVGTSELRQALDAGRDWRPWVQSWAAQEDLFARDRRPFLRY